MSNNENLTVWQRLSATFGPNSLLNQDIPTYKFDKKELLRTQNKVEFEREKLQAQQSFYLSNQWAKIDNHLYTQAVYYEPTRLASVYDFESMEYSIAGETKIATPNGFITIKELADKGRDYEFITYAYDHNLKKVVPAKAYNAHYTRDEMTYKITFDDNSHIIATHGHRFLKRDGVFCVVEELEVGDSMMPFYRKSFYNNQNYHWVYSCNKDEGHHGWVSEHKLIAEWFYDKKVNFDEEVHHIDFNGKNNLPENLQIMKINEHRSYHAKIHNQKLWANPDFRKKMSEVAKRKGKISWGGRREGKNNPSYIKLDFDKLVEVAKSARLLNETAKQLGVSFRKIQNELRFKGFKHWDDFLKFYGIKKYLIQSENYELVDFRVIPWDLLVETAREEKLMKNVANKLGITVSKLSSTIETGGYKNWTTFMAAYGLNVGKTGRKKVVEENIVNHKIISIEPYGVVPVYDLTVPGYKNFATDTIFSHNTPEIGAALDIYAEESTTSNEDGHMLQIYSESKRIKSVLTDLFNNVLDINTSLPMWTRNTPIREDSIIPLLDGTEVTIKELSERIKKGEEVWTYSIQQGTTAIVCSKIIWCDLTRENSELIRVTFDDGTYIDTTPDHEYMLRNGSFMRADLLKPNQSLMPFYTKKSEKSKDKIVDYEKVYNPNTGKYKFTHRMVAHEYVRNLEYENSINENFDTHHIDFRKNNNNPINLIRLRRSEHFELHIKHYDKILGTPEVIKKRIEGSIKYLKSDSRRERMSNEMKGIYPKYFEEYNNSELHSKHNEIRSLGMLRNWSSSTFIEKTKKGMTIHLNDKCISHITNIILNSNKFIGINELSLTLKKDNEFINLFKETYTLNKNPLKSINPTTLNKLFFRKLNKNYFEFVLSINPNLSLDKKFIKAKSIHLGKTRDITILNHKVVSVTKLEETSNVYCLEAVGPNGEHDRHNFAVCSKDINGNHTRNGVFLANCKFGDNFVFLKLDPEKGIVGCNQLPNIEIERLEPGSAEKASGYGELSSENDSLKFKWKNKQMEFQPWEIAHFRILGDDRKLPYGTSLLEKARRIWKQLLLSEDAMLIYRTSRAPERRVFKVFVGNMDDNDVEAYVQRVANKFKREQIVDSKTGNVDMRYNQMAVDQDYFVPVRDPGQASPIETLAGASNLGEIADIEYIQKKLVTALRIPKTFLGFEDVVGDGKTLSLQDIRFARTINRIQKCMISELNKIAIIHLFLLGFEDEISNFTLGLTNPSTQSDLLKIDIWKEKIGLYRDAVSDPGTGIAPVSATWAKKHIFGFSDEEIRLDLQQQRIEKAVGEELKQTPLIIKKTGLFDNIDKLYGSVSGGTASAGATPPPPDDMGGMDMGGMDMGGMDMGAPPPPPPPPPGGGEMPPPGEPGLAPESRFDNLNILSENNKINGLNYSPFTKGQKSLGDLENELKKLLG
jgi:hypothetical protein